MSAEQTVPVTVAAETTQPQQPVDGTSKNSWSEMIVETKASETIAVAPKEEVKPLVQSKFYKEKYNESDWVLMFYNPSTPLEQWMVKDLLETIDVRARGIRQGKTGKCYADFEDEETWNSVKKLSGEIVGETAIFVDDVPPRTDAPKNTFNKGQQHGKKTQSGAQKKKGTFAKKQNSQKDGEKEGETPSGDKKVKKPKKAAEKPKKEEKVVLDETEKEEGWEISSTHSKVVKTKKQTKKQLDGVASTKNYFEGI